ncbi:MAG: Maf family protein, partial [Chloroflexota bacterium]
ARTGVQMRDYSDDEIEASIERGDPFDKAGGYAIQDRSLDPASGYEGCYCNVVGLPLAAVAGTFQRAGLPFPRITCETCPFNPALR